MVDGRAMGPSGPKWQGGDWGIMSGQQRACQCDLQAPRAVCGMVAGGGDPSPQSQNRRRMESVRPGPVEGLSHS